jgi:dihydrofolate synthase/folylpolyglutamate synthase
MIKSIDWDFKLNRTQNGFSLEPIKDLLFKIGNPEQKIPFPIHIVGTNGKGSTTAFLEAILREAGFLSNVYTSPNLVAINERIKIAGREISDADLLEEIEKIPKNVSFFEALTTIAFKLFSISKAQFSLIEAGLGGRLDATNVINSKICVLTSVSLDHTNLLGSTIQKIAEEKLAIDKSCPFVIAKQPYREVYSYSLSVKNPIIYGEDYKVEEAENDFKYTSKNWDLSLPKPSLRGSHQIFNAGTAIRVIEVLVFEYGFKISYEAIKKGLISTVWRARFQPLYGKIKLKFPHLEVFLDGAHNENGVKVCLEEAKKLQKPVHLICGFLKRKNLEEIAPQFEGINLHLTEIHSSEVCFSKEELMEVFLRYGIKPASINSYFYNALSQIKEPARVVIMGSLYLAGEVLEWQEV